MSDPELLADRVFNLGLRYQRYREMKRARDPRRFYAPVEVRRQFEWLDAHPQEARELQKYTDIRLKHEQDIAWKIKHQLVIGEVLGQPVVAESPKEFYRYRDNAIAVAGLDAIERNLFGALGLGLAQATHPGGSNEYQVRAGELMGNVGNALLAGSRTMAVAKAVKDYRVPREPARRLYGKRKGGEWKPGQPPPPSTTGARYVPPIFPPVITSPQPRSAIPSTPQPRRKRDTEVQPWYGDAFRNERETTKLITRLNNTAAQPGRGPSVWHGAATATLDGLGRSGKPLGLGSRGEDVRAVQRLLGMSRADQDAIWGPRTQRRYEDRLRSYGISGSQASAELFRRMAVDVERMRQLAETGTVLRVGSRGDDVKLLQRALGMPAHMQDKIYGPRTAHWVQKKQAEFGITRDSAAGPQTFTHLLRAYAIGR